MALQDYYVDPGGGNDATGDGSITTPWQTCQYALNTITRNTSGGDRINVKSGTADVLSGTLSLAAYGTPSSSAPLFFRGYDSVLKDGGIGEIDGGGSYSVVTGAAYVNFIDMKLGNTGSSDILDYSIFGHVINCELHTSSGLAIDMASYSRVIGCYFHDLTGYGAIDMSSYNLVAYCYFNVGVSGRVMDAGSGANLHFNIIHLVGANNRVDGIYMGGSGMNVIGNTLYSTVANKGKGIYMALDGSVVMNNIVEGWCGTGGLGFYCTQWGVVSNNAAYNNTTNFYLVAGEPQYEGFGPNTVLAASPFTNPAAGDFSLNGTISGITEAAYPSLFNGSATASAADVGAAQEPAGAGGGGGGLLAASKRGGKQ